MQTKPDMVAALITWSVTSTRNKLLPAVEGFSGMYFDRLEVDGGRIGLARPSGCGTGVAAVCQWVGEYRAEIEHALRESGALLFRGIDVSNASEFGSLCRAFDPGLLDYRGGGSPRTHLADGVYTSTEYPASQAIPLHGEASYFVEMPRNIWFFCEFPPDSGGQTPLVDMAAVLAKLPTDLIDRFSQHGLKYVSNFHDGAGFGRGWREALMTDSRSEAETWLDSQGLEYGWRDDGALQIFYSAPAVRHHPDTKVPFWANQAVNWHPAGLGQDVADRLHKVYGSITDYPKMVSFGNGDLIPDEDIVLVQSVLENAQYVFDWQKGDVLLLDNHRTGHGRQKYAGRRSILVAIS